MTADRTMTCATVDELGSAWALGAVDREEERLISTHLDTCPRDHAGVRAAIEAAALLDRSLEPIEPSPALRSRLMTSVAATPQDHRRMAVGETARRSWWIVPRSVLTATAGVALAAAIGLGAWGLARSGDVAERDAVIRAFASADSVVAVDGTAGFGWLVSSDEGAMFVSSGIADLPADRLYELWLIGTDGVPRAVGTFTETDDVIAVALERPIGDAAAFAITVESERVSQPTGDPVLVAELET